MMADNHKRAWHLARESVEALIARMQISGITHLPALRVLASSCGVTPVTMRSVLDVFCKAGIIQIRKGVGIFVNTPHSEGMTASASPEPDAGRPTTTLCASVSHAIASDIDSGFFRLDRPLPSYKELRSRYGASYTLLRKALRTLLPTGMIERRGRGYRISQAQPHPASNTVILIARSGDKATLCNYTPRSIDFWRELEVECKRTNVAVEIMGYTTAVELLRKGGHGNILGYMVWVLGLSMTEMHDLGILLIKQTAPVSMLDEIGRVPIPLPVRNNPFVKYYSMANTVRCGEILGKYLFGLGHRRIAFFLPVKGDPWNDNRITGLDAIFRLAGIHGAVTTHAPPSFKGFDQVYEKINTDPPFKELAEHRRRHAGFYGPEYAALQSTYYEDQAHHMLSTNFWYGVLEPLFQDALADTSITAWVGVTDVIALLALDFLTRQKIAVPGRISVCGFDDTNAALGSGLTSYNFRMTAVVRSMMDHLLRPDLTLNRRPEMPVEIDGYVMGRETSGPAVGTVLRTVG